MRYPEIENMNLIKLSVTQAFSEFGKQVSGIALPLIAVLTLNVTPFQLGVLRSLEYIPFVTIGLFAGIWIDKYSRRDILILSKLGNALILLTIPISVITNNLSFELLLFVTFFAGLFTVFFELALPAYLPSVVKSHNKVKGYANLEISKSIADIAGLGIGGWLVDLITAPFSITIDVISSFISSVVLMRIPQDIASTSKVKIRVKQELSDGFRKIWSNEYLRPIVLGILTANFCDGMINSIIFIYLTKELFVNPTLLGIIFAIGSLGGFFGAFAVGRINQFVGIGPTLIGSAILIGFGRLLIPFAESGQSLLLFLISAYFLTGFSFALYGVNLKSLSQANVPHDFLGRVFSVQRFIAWGTLSIGLLFGGAIANLLSLRNILILSAIGIILSALWIIFSPIRKLRS